MISKLKALTLLDECTGRDIWSVEHCRQQGVPDSWIAELADAFESNPQQDQDAIYYKGAATNQFHGVRDIDLAMKLGDELGIDVHRISAMTVSREATVTAIKEAVEEG